MISKHTLQAISRPATEQDTAPTSFDEVRTDASSLALSEVSDALAVARSTSAVQAVKAAVAELRVNVKSAISHREKCSILLSAAMAASLALEQVLYAGGIDKVKENQVQRLCSELVAVTDLAATRVKVYGRAPKWKKYVKIAQRRAVQGKFDELVLKLKSMTQQAWSLQNEPSLPRISVSRLRTETRGDSDALDSDVLSALAQGIQHTVLSRTRLRKGGQAQKIRALMYIPVHQSSGAHQALGQVWWYASGLIKGRVSVHNVATSKTLEVAVSSPVTCLQLDARSHIWLGHRGGGVSVYSEATCKPVCTPMRCCSCDITCMMLARSGMAWVGSEEGSVHLVSLMQPANPSNATAVLHLATKPANTRSWRNMLTPRSSSISSKQQSASFSEKLVGTGSIEAESFTISSGNFSHDGAVTAIQGCSMRVWSAGSGGSRHASLMEWAPDGKLRDSIQVPPELGAINAMAVMPMWDGGRQVEGPARTPVTAALVAVPPVVKELINWILATGHESGSIQIWDGRGGPVAPCLVIPAWTSPCRSLVVCESLGLWCSGHADGTIVLRLLSSLDLDGMPPAQQGQAVGRLQPSAQQATLESHRSGLDTMVGCSLGVFTASQFGSIDLWPETELRQAAEAAGFVLPTEEESFRHLARLHSGTYSPLYADEAGGKQPISSQSVSTMLQRYFTPASSALAVAAVQRAVESESARRSLLTTQRPNGESVELGRDSDVSMSSTSTARGLLAEVVALLRPLEGSGEGQRVSDASDNPSLSAMQQRTSMDMDSAMLGMFAPGETATGRTSQEVVRSSSASDNLSLGSEPRSNMGSLSTGVFRPEAHSDWIVDFKDLQFLRLMGEGSIGRVHHGRWQETDVAIKTINSLSHMRAALASAEQASESQPEDGSEERKVPIAQGSFLQDQQSLLRSLEREVGVMAAIRHPNVVLFMGVCLEPACLVTEWCSRGSVYDILVKARKNPALGAQLDWPRRLAMALDAAKGMLQLHSHRPHILHRDLKSPNLVVDRHWHVKVTDFNLSRIMYNTAVTSSVSANNPRWLAPEAIATQSFSKAADVYSFGIILWELITWQLPWEEFGPFQIMVAVAERGQRPDIPQDLSTVPGGDSPAAYGLVTLMQRCWSQEPADRPGFDIIVITLRNLLESIARRRPSGKQPTSPGDASSSPHLSPAVSTREPFLDANGRASSSESLTSASPHAVPGMPPSICEQPFVENEVAYSSAQSSLSPQSSSTTGPLGSHGEPSQPAPQLQDRNIEAALSPTPAHADAHAHRPALPLQPTARPIAAASPFASAAALGSFASLDGDEHSDASSGAEDHTCSESAAPHSSAHHSCNSLGSLRHQDREQQQHSFAQDVGHPHHQPPEAGGRPPPAQASASSSGRATPMLQPGSSSFRFARHNGASASGMSTPSHPGQPSRSSMDSSLGELRGPGQMHGEPQQAPLLGSSRLSESEARMLWERTSPAAAVPKMHRRRSLSTGEGIALLLATFGGGKHPQYPVRETPRQAGAARGHQ